MTAKLTSAERAAKLPAPTPETIVTISLVDWPAYQELHGIEAMDRAEVSQTEQRTGTRKQPGMVWVRRAGETS